MLTTQQIDSINLKTPPIWKAPFYEFIGGKLSLIDLESKVYETTQLEGILERDVYFDLITFNFSDSQNYSTIYNFILEKILIDESEYDCKLFSLIGSFYTNGVNLSLKKSLSIPEAVVKIFKGAHIKPKWKGVSNPACDVEFLSKVAPLGKLRSTDCRSILPPSVVLVGYAHHQYIDILMDTNGIVYLFLVISNELYYCGEGLLKVLKKLFFGLEYGKLLCRPQL